MMSTAQVWGLALRTQTPDMKAFERLLGHRYGQNEDDVEHEDPFAALP